MAYIKTRPTTTLKIKVVNVKCTNLTDIPHNVPLANAVLTSHVYSFRNHTKQNRFIHNV